MPVVALAFIVIVVLVIAVSGSSPPTTGYDASYPQCSGSYPSNPLFGIVGVNGGLANNANSCISGELHWARDAPGQKRPKQPPLSLYIDAGNPGGDHVADLPSVGTAPAYGTCNGLLTNSCSYIYGEQRAAHSYRIVAALDQVAAELHERWVHRRGAEPCAVPDRSARRRPALYWHALTTPLTRPTSEITIALPREGS